MPRYKAVFTDLDGTLLDEQGKITPETRAVISRLRARGVPLFVATGRSVCATETAIEDLGLRTPLICYNGAVVFDPLSREWLRHETVEDHVTEELLDLCEAHARFYLVYHEDAKVTLPPRFEFQSKFYGRLENIRHVARFEDLPRRSVTKFSIFTDTDDPGHAIYRFLQNGGSDHYVERFRMNTIPGFRDFPFHSTDVHARAGGKGEGVRFVMERYALKSEEVVAIGDHMNDLTMLEEAGHSVAMNDAPQELLDRADRVIAHDDGNGVARLLSELFDI